MILSKKSKRYILFYLAAFLFVGITHVLLYPTGIYFLNSSSQFMCGVLTVLWGVTIWRRVIDKRLRKLILWAVFFLLLQFIMQIVRYNLIVGSITIKRYLWYAYSITTITLPVLFYALVLSIYRSKENRLPRSVTIFALIGVLLLLGIFTNDLHFGYYSFPDGILDDAGNETRGWLFYLASFFSYSLSAVSLGVVLKKSSIYPAKKYRLLPAIPILIGIIYFVLYPLNLEKMLLPCRIYNLGEMYAFCVILMLEICIQMGLIPANMGYEKLFESAPLEAVLLNNSGEPVFKTKAAYYPFVQNEATKVEQYCIGGGLVEWAVDISKLNQLNESLREASEKITARNEYIREETRIKKDKAEIETRNRLYDNISQIIQPQLEKMDALLKEGSALGKMAVIGAYIKRCSNMEVLSEGGSLTVFELHTAISETLHCLQMCGVHTAMSCAGTGLYPAVMIMNAYKNVEEIIEASMENLTDISVIIRAKTGELTVRILLKAYDFAIQIEEGDFFNDFTKKILVTKDQNDMLIALTFTERRASV